MKQSIQLRLGQQLTMTPQLQQAIRLLQLSALDNVTSAHSSGVPASSKKPWRSRSARYSGSERPACFRRRA